MSVTFAKNGCFNEIVVLKHISPCRKWFAKCNITMFDETSKSHDDVQIQKFWAILRQSELFKPISSNMLKSLGKPCTSTCWPWKVSC